MKLPEEARLNEEEIWKVDNELGKDDLYLRMDDHQSVLYREGRFCEAQLAKAAPIIEAQAKKEERERLIKKIEALFRATDYLSSEVGRRLVTSMPVKEWQALKEGK